MPDIIEVDLTASSDEEDEDTSSAIEECLRECSHALDEAERSSIYSVETVPCKEEPEHSEDSGADDAEGDTDTTLRREEPCSASKSPLSRERSDVPAEASVGAEPALPLETSFQSADDASQSDFHFDKGRVTVLEVPRDGHCLYRACLHQRRPRSRRLEMPTNEEVAELRSAVAHYMKENRAHLGAFFLADVEGQTLSDSIKSVESGHWGDQASISAVANIYRCPVEVYTEMGSMIAHFPEGQDSVGLSPNSRPRQPLRIAFRCWDDDEGGIVYNHYDSVLKVVLDAPASTPSLWPRPSSSTPPRADAADGDSPGTPARGRGLRRSLRVSPRQVKRLCVDADAPSSPPPTTPPTKSPPARCDPVDVDAASSPPPSVGGPLPRDSTASSLARSRSGAGDVAEENTALRSSQELVDRSSPIPGLDAPGSPSMVIRTASQGDQEHGAGDNDSDSMERLMTTMFSTNSPVGDTNVSSCASRTSSERGRIHLAPLLDSPAMAADFDVAEVSTSQKTREWLRSVPSPPTDMEEEEVQETMEARVSFTTVEMMTNVTTIYDGTLCEWICDRGVIQHHTNTVPKATNGHRTISTNVRFHSGQLFGTFQVHSYN